MKWLKLKPNKQSILCLGGILALLVLGCIGLFAKQQASLASEVAALQEKEKQLADGHAVAARVEATEKLLGSDQVVVLSRVAAPIDVQIQAGDGGAVRAPLRELPQEIPVDDLWHGTILSFTSGIRPQPPQVIGW